MRRRVAGAVLLFVAVGCSPDRFTAALRVVDESGAALPDAWAEFSDTVAEANGDGVLHLADLDHPVLAIVSAPGHLSEPVPVGRGSVGDEVEVGLLADSDADGNARIVMHFGGDVMLGRRYLEPTEGEPLLRVGDGGTSARAVVSDLSGAFGLADLRFVNLETVVGDLDGASAYPGKRWLIQTPPEGLAALDELAVDAAILANNHQRDWLDEGQQSTLDALGAAEQDFVGAGSDEEMASSSIIFDNAATTVGVLAYTSVDGDYVNDQYPTDDEIEPDDLDAEDAWLWQWKEWGEPSLGVPVASRRIGGAWEALTEAESLLDTAQQTELWTSAEAVYPELQDWVARRGHGGANRWHGSDSVAEIAALSAQVDITVVQLHMGYQFADAPGDGLTSVVQDAVAAGADIVVGHHPHVLQGLEWVDDHLVAYSLGNLVFDQDFRSTWDSAFLRTVWTSDGTLVQARLVPLIIDDYRPVPAVDELGEQVLRQVWARGQVSGHSDRGSDLAVRVVADADGPPAGATGMVLEHGTARLTRTAPEVVIWPVFLPAGRPVSLPRLGLFRWRLSSEPPSDVEQGRSLYRLGSFEDLDTDGESGDVPGWTWSSVDVTLVDDGGVGEAPSSLQVLQLVRGPDNQDAAYARGTARATVLDHRVFADADGDFALDGAARYSVRLDAWVAGEADLGEIRLVLYHFNDLDPSSLPESTPLRQVDLPFSLSRRTWTTLDLDVPASAFDPVDGLTPNAVLLYVRLNPPASRTTVLRVDRIDLVQWRPVDDEPDGWGDIDYLRSTDGRSRVVSVDVLPW